MPPPWRHAVVRAEQALARVRGGEDFATVARELSEDGNRAAGGEIGLRPVDRLPDLFVDGVRDLAVGQVTPQLLRSAAGFHVLKVVDRQQADAFKATQTCARHILLRLSERAQARRWCGAWTASASRSSVATSASRTWRATSRRMAAPPAAATSAGPGRADMCPSSRRR